MKTRTGLLAGACLLVTHAALAAGDPGAAADGKPRDLLSGSTAGQPAAAPPLRPIEADEAQPLKVPERGANSFTDAQARRWIQERGYNVVGNLLKDGNGVWHAEVTKAGSRDSTMVALDFKGNVIEEQAYSNHPTTPLRVAPPKESGAAQSGSTEPAPANPIDGTP